MSKVCSCRGISEKQIIKAIKGGATSYHKVKEETGAGTGGCKGHKCKDKIEKLIKENK